MKRVLLLSGLIALLASGTAHAQYVFIDVDGDMACDGNDVITDATTSIDVYIDTNHNKDGSSATCSDGTSPLDILSYEFILHCKTTDISFGVWTNDIGSFTTQTAAPVFNGQDYHVGRGGTLAISPGKYKLGSLAITVATGANPIIAPVPDTDTQLDPLGDWFTGFGSTCTGAGFNNTVLLGPRDRSGTPADFTDACGPGAPSPNRTTTWGAIKSLYR